LSITEACSLKVSYYRLLSLKACFYRQLIVRKTFNRQLKRFIAYLHVYRRNERSYLMSKDHLLRAYRGETTPHTPAWYMRQAGRSQKEYREIKQKYSLFEITHNPELCAYITRLPVEQYDNDAAILYKDIMTPLPALGIDVEIKSGIGPVIDNPINNIQDVEALGELNPEQDIDYVLETITLLTEEQLNVPLIGFSGAPFTLASYMIEGGPSK